MGDENPAPELPHLACLPLCLQRVTSRACGGTPGEQGRSLHCSILLEGRVWRRVVHFLKCTAECLPTPSGPHVDGGKVSRRKPSLVILMWVGSYMQEILA